jgi:predicted RNase H-like HicB family nuclease
MPTFGNNWSTIQVTKRETRVDMKPQLYQRRLLAPEARVDPRARLSRTAAPSSIHVHAVPYQWRTSAAMKRIIQVRILRGEKQYVAECLDLPVVTEAPTLDELAANIREAIALHLEGENLAELGLVDDPTILATLELDAVA